MKTELLDPLQRIFVALENTVNVNTHQMVVLAGPLQLPRLRAAVARTVSEFDLCTSGVDGGGVRLIAKRWSPQDAPLHHVPFSGPISFGNPGFRQSLMRLSQWHPLRWRRRPPVQFFYVSDESGAGPSAVMLNSHHGLADAKADTLLLERLLQNYGAASDRPTPIRPEVPALRNVPGLYREIQRRRGSRGRLAELADVAREIARDLLVRCTGFGRRGAQDASDEMDFVYREMSAETEARVRAIAQHTQHTINTVITAALHMVLRRSRPESAKPIKILCPVSLRPMIGDEYRETFHNLMVPCSLTLAARYESSGALLSAIAERVSEIKRGKIFSFASRLAALQPIAALAGNSAILPRLLELFQGSNACYSNPGVVSEQLDSFGASGPAVLQYAAFGCVIPPYDFILYTPQFRDRLHMNAIFRRKALADVEADLIAPLEAAVAELASELGIASCALVAEHPEPRVGALSAGAGA
jgi:hypothetical protein